MPTFDEYFDQLNRSGSIGPNAWPEALQGIIELAQRAPSTDVQTALERLARNVPIPPFWYAKATLRTGVEHRPRLPADDPHRHPRRTPAGCRGR